MADACSWMSTKKSPMKLIRKSLKASSIDVGRCSQLFGELDELEREADT